MTLFAAIFLFVFGSLGAWLLYVKFPEARFTRAAYIFMAIGGLAFMLWSFTHMLGAGIAAIVLLVAGGTLGIVGAIRKEVRMVPPS